MAIMVVGGHSRNIGKTSVVTGLISALPSYNWTAFKITQFEPGEYSLAKEPHDHASEDGSWAINEEHDRFGKSDSSRFLAAGASRAFWVRTEYRRLHEAVPEIQHQLAEAENAIIESNSILQFIQPDLYITVLDPATEDFKSSAQQYLDRADAIVIHDNQMRGQTRNVILAGLGVSCSVFRISPPPYVNADVVRFVAERLNARRATIA